MKYDLVELRKFLPDYVDTITKKEKNTRNTIALSAIVV